MHFAASVRASVEGLSLSLLPLTNLAGLFVLTRFDETVEWPMRSILSVIRRRHACQQSRLYRQCL